MSRVSRDLPDVIPVFPLAGALLLPHGNLPLNIFEPRYLAMVEDAMKGAKMIGMVQPRPGEQDKPAPALYDIGCAGVITEHAPTDDGRILITLTGLSRFELSQELSCTTPYRQVMADFEPFAEDRERPGNGQSLAARDAFIGRLQAFLHAVGLDADWDAIAATPDDLLVNAVAMICPFGPAEKQALLECTTVDERADTMIALMDFALAGGDDGGAVN